MPTSFRPLLAVGVFVVFVLLLGATYQGVATALERRQFQRPGRLIDVGGRQLHIYCEGEGSPTVVLEAPGLGMSAAWGWVQAPVARETRVCSYDRAGLGWSELGDREFDPRSVPVELHTLLERSGERAPYVLVGQGLGAIFATQFARQYATDTAALVLLEQPDSQTPGRPRVIRYSPWLARFGILRVTGALSRHADGLPEPSAGALRKFLNRPDHLSEAVAELARWPNAHETLTPDLAVVRVAIPGSEQTPFLVDKSSAESAVAAILNAVATTRRASISSRHPSS